jgi:hypothetical protein
MTTMPPTKAAGRHPVLSDDGLYRYSLRCDLDGDGGILTGLLCNPATSDGREPTITRFINLGNRLGFSQAVVVNLYARITGNPNDLRKFADPIGPENDAYLLAALDGAADDGGMVICAWGGTGIEFSRVKTVFQWIPDEAYCLRLNEDRNPCHPSRASNGLTPIPFTYADWRG